jgi:PAS domain S-box-containing protein
VLADSSGDLGLLGKVLRVLDARQAARDLPLILLGDASDVGLLADLTTRRFNATLLAKPVEPTQLAAAVQAGLRYWAGRRENRRLMAQLEAARDEAERRRAEAEAARRRYHDLVNGLDSVVWETDAATGRFTFMSDRAEDVFGYPCENWIKEPGFWLERVIPDDREYAHGAWERGHRTGRDFELEYRATTADGRTIWIREVARVSRGDQGEPLGLRGLMWNITKRKKVERQLYKAKRELAERVSELSYLHELSTRLSATLELEPTLEEVLAAVMGVLGAEAGVLRLLDAGRGELYAAASAGFEAESGAPIDPLPVGRGICGVAMARSRPVFVADMEADLEDSDLIGAARPAGCRAVYSTPLIPRSGEPLGTIAAYFRESRRPPERQVRLVELYARHAAAVVEHARLHRELRDADRRKDEFLAMLAHELRNPLGAILGAAQVLNFEGATKSDVAESGNMILRQGRHMTRLIDDMLDVSRIRRGTLPTSKVPVRVEEAVDQAVEAVRSLIDARGHELTVAIPSEPLWLEADPERLAQILVNLLTNAARYTEPGGLIALQANREAEVLVLRVRDNGIGIAPEALPRIFGLFTQADPGANQSRKGLGIGLALVRSLVELHGGSVSASSPGQGRGSEFVVRLPLIAPPGGDPSVGGAAETTPDSRADTRHKRVLVVDDQADAALSLAWLLKAWGHEVYVAHDGPAALEAAQAHAPELVLLDIGLPGMDGHEVARRLRMIARNGLQIIALTGYAREEDRSRSREAGFNDHLVKPIDPEDLRRMLGG